MGCALAKGTFLHYNAPDTRFCSGKPAQIQPAGMTSDGRFINENKRKTRCAFVCVRLRLPQYAYAERNTMSENNNRNGGRSGARSAKRAPQNAQDMRATPLIGSQAEAEQLQKKKLLSKLRLRLRKLQSTTQQLNKLAICI